MYSLTLTADERQAFDWVGDRYNSGKVADLLLDCIPKTGSGATTATSRSPSLSTWPGKSMSLPRKRTMPGHASPRHWLPSSTTFAGALFEPTRSRRGYGGAIVLTCPDRTLLLTEYRLVHLPPVNCDSLRVLNPKPHLVAPDLDHRQDDVVPEDDALVLLALDKNTAEPP